MNELGKSAAWGAAGNAFGGIVGNIGRRIKDYSRATPTITNIKYPMKRWDGPIGNYERSGAAIGAVVGSLISNGGSVW